MNVVNRAEQFLRAATDWAQPPLLRERDFQVSFAHGRADIKLHGKFSPDDLDDLESHFALIVRVLRRRPVKVAESES